MLKAFFIDKRTGGLFEIQGAANIKKCQQNTRYQQIDAHTASLRADFSSRGIIT